MGTAWTSWDAEQRLIEATRTIRRLPAGEWARLGRLRVSWPSYVHDREIVYGWEAAKAPRIRPTSAEITRMDEAMAWMAELMGPGTIDEQRDRLPSDTARILWLRSGHATWKEIAEARFDVWGRHRGRGGPSAVPMGNSPPSLRRIHKAGLALLAERLEVAGVENPDASEAEATPESPSWQRRLRAQHQPLVDLRLGQPDEHGIKTPARATLKTGRKPLVAPPPKED